MRIAALLLLMLLMVKGGYAQQSRQDLERRRAAILASIRESQEQLAETKKNKNATMSQLRVLQAKLNARLRLIDNINEEMEAISGTIRSSTTEVVNLQTRLNQLKMHYAQSIRYAYADRSSSSMLAFIFSSKDYNDAVRRLKYLKRYRTYRQQQVDAIRTMQGQVEHKIGELNYQKLQKNALLSAQEQQRKELQQETNETNGVVRDLRSREKQLLADIRRNQQAARKVQRAVEAIIRREIEEQRRKAEEEARRKAEAQRLAEEKQKSYGGMNVATGSNPEGRSSSRNDASTSNPSSVTSYHNKPKPQPAASTVNLSLTPEAQALSNSFASNQGRLPWPVERGTITGYFGLHKHPVANVMIDNNGIDIQTTANAAVRAVFSGTVSGVFYVPGSGQNVIVQHGDYYTVYANLASASVHKGQPVTTKQTIGVAGNNDDGLPMVNFQIWKSNGHGSVNLDPQKWIASQ